MMTKPIRALGLQYPMIQFLIKVIIIHQESKPAKLLKKRSGKRLEEQVPVLVLNSSFYVYYQGLPKMIKRPLKIIIRRNECTGNNKGKL